MAARCQKCQAETEAGLVVDGGVLCPRCASEPAHALVAAESRLSVRPAEAEKRETAVEYAARRELSAIVDSRREFHRRLEELDKALAWLKLQMWGAVLVVPPAVIYLLYRGARVFACLMAGATVWSVATKALEMLDGLGRRRRLITEDLETEGAYRRYRALQQEAKHLDHAKQELLRRQILPKLRALMEEKLPYLMQRRFEFASFLHAYRLTDLQSEVDALARQLQAETDSEVQEALGKRLNLARARLGHFQTLARRLKLYQIHLENLESHMENLVARVVMLDPSEDLRRATDSIMSGLTEEVELLEEAYREVNRD